MFLKFQDTRLKATETSESSNKKMRNEWFVYDINVCTTDTQSYDHRTSRFPISQTDFVLNLVPRNLTQVTMQMSGARSGANKL
jgi:hypothetical protein